MNKSKQVILFAPYNLLAHYLRCVEVAKTLSDDYEIIFLFSQRYGHFVEENGFSQTEPLLAKYKNVVSKTHVFDFSWINKSSVSNVVKDLIDVIKKYNPDLVFGDTYPGLRIACAVSKKKLAVLVNSYVTMFYDGYRPIPHKHRANNYRPLVSPEVWKKIVRQMEKLTLWNVHRPFRFVRTKYGLKIYKNLFEEFAGDLNFICDDTNVFMVKNLPENFIVTGPVLFRSTQKESELLNLMQVAAEKPAIFISTGSSGQSIVPGILTEAQLSNYTVIVSGASEDSVVANVIYRKFVNFDEISSLVKLVICHGGNGTMYQAIAGGKNIIAVPSMFEQEWNTYTFEKAGKCSVLFAESSANKFMEQIINLISVNHTENPVEYKLSDLFLTEVKKLLNQHSD